MSKALIIPFVAKFENIPPPVDFESEPTLLMVLEFPEVIIITALPVTTKKAWYHTKISPITKHPLKLYPITVENISPPGSQSIPLGSQSSEKVPFAIGIKKTKRKSKITPLARKNPFNFSINVASLSPYESFTFDIIIPLVCIKEIQWKLLLLHQSLNL